MRHIKLKRIINRIGDTNYNEFTEYREYTEYTEFNN